MEGDVHAADVSHTEYCYIPNICIYFYLASSFFHQVGELGYSECVPNKQLLISGWDEEEQHATLEDSQGPRCACCRRVRHTEFCHIPTFIVPLVELILL